MRLVNYYQDSWIHRSDTLAPLTRLASNQVAWNWTDAEQVAFDRVKRIVAREVLLAYPDFSQKIEIYTNISECQLGAVITQAGKPLLATAESSLWCS